MVASDLARCAVFVVLPFAGGAGTIVALAAVVGLAAGLFRPAVYAALPNLVGDRQLPRANSLLQGAENVSWAVGPLLGGALVAASGPDLAYWINAATFLVSAALIAGIPGRLLQTAVALGKGHWRDIAEGVALVRRSRALLVVLAAWTVAMVGNGAINVSQIFLAEDTFDAGAFGFGLLFGSVGVGLAVGSVVTGAVVERRAIRAVYPATLAVMAIGFAAAAAAPSIWVAAALAGVAGIGNGGAGVCNALLVQRGAPDELRGRAFTLIMSVNYAVLGLAMAAAGPLVDAVGPRWVWAGAGIVFALAAWVALALAPRAATGEPAAAREPVGASDVVPVGERSAPVD